MMSRQDDSYAAPILAALATGLGIGFGLGILFAPNSGKKTRATIARKADRSIGEIRDRVEDLRSSASDLIDKGIETVQSSRDNVNKSLDSVKKAYRQVAG